MRVYLDNCCYNRPFDDQSQLKVRLGTDGDYTEWRRTHLYQNVTLEELAAKAKEAGEIVRLRERVLAMADARRPKARSAKKKESSRRRRAAPAVPAQT